MVWRASGGQVLCPETKPCALSIFSKHFQTNYHLTHLAYLVWSCLFQFRHRWRIYKAMQSTGSTPTVLSNLNRASLWEQFHLKGGEKTGPILRPHAWLFWVKTTHSRVAVAYPMVILKDSPYSHDQAHSSLVPLARLSAMALPSAHPHLWPLLGWDSRYFAMKWSPWNKQNQASTKNSKMVPFHCSETEVGTASLKRVGEISTTLKCMILWVIKHVILWQQ